MIANRWMNVVEAAELLHCDPSRIRQLLIRKQVIGQKFTGRGWAVDRKSLLKYAEKPRFGGRPKKTA